MIKLIIDNSFVEIRGANKECEFEIWDKLSFEIENFNSPYIQKKHLFNRNIYKCISRSKVNSN